jgi:signal transduction histidine kinase
VIEIVGRDLPVTSPAHAVVKDVHLEIRQINHILTDLLQTARPHPPEVRPSDLNRTVEHAVVLACQQVLSRPIEIEFQNNPTLPNVEHDSEQIHQVVLNLLLNAIQAIEGAGQIRVEISLLKGDAAITVADTGRGIAPEHLPNIFSPFYTTKANGTGLGLSLARRIAEEHHGRIEVTSEVGRGTTFLLVLPLQQVAPQCAAS